MLTCQEGKDFTLTIEFTDALDAVIVPVSVSAILLDGYDKQLAEFTPISFTPGDPSTTLVIPAIHHALSDEGRSVRVAVVTITTATGTVTKTFGYVVEADRHIRVMVNSFQSYYSAEALALTVSNIVGWASAGKDLREAAMSEAFFRIASIPMIYDGELSATLSRFDYDVLTPSTQSNYISRDLWDEMTLDNYLTLPSRFRRALCMAQFLEANELLLGDMTLDRYRAGIQSETVGESSVVLRAGRVDYGLSAAALKALSGYIYSGMRIVRG